ncbi:MAG: GTPase HflX, partial [Gemmatimonadetes bacterium]|nr:GTPase HflX [Gemmatimonadota bacterium]
LVVHLVDLSHPGYEAQIRAVESILEELGYGEIPRLLVFNKIDLLPRDEVSGALAGNKA